MGVKVQRPSGRKDWTYRFAKGGALPPTRREQGGRIRGEVGDMPLAEISR